MGVLVERNLEAGGDAFGGVQQPDPLERVVQMLTKSHQVVGGDDRRRDEEIPVETDRGMFAVTVVPEGLAGAEREPLGLRAHRVLTDNGSFDPGPVLGLVEDVVVGQIREAEACPHANREVVVGAQPRQQGLVRRRRRGATQRVERRILVRQRLAGRGVARHVVQPREERELVQTAYDLQGVVPTFDTPHATAGEDVAEVVRKFRCQFLSLSKK